MTPGDTPVTSALRPGWWVRALARHERSAMPSPVGGAPAFRPTWCGIAEQAVARAVVPDELPDTDSWQEAFAVPLRPMLTLVRDRMTAAAERHLDSGTIDAHQVARTFTDVLASRLARIAVRSFMADLAAAAEGDALAGTDDQERFTSFMRDQCTPGGLGRMFERYPVLARLLSTVALSAAEAGAELLTRLAADRTAVIETLLGGTNPGPAVVVEPGLGDSHRHGRSVIFVRFADGRTIVYKPRSLAAQARFGDVIGWLNRRLPGCRLQSASTVVRQGYGWMEYVQHRPLPRAADAQRFYQRAGMLLAVLYALNATDMHCENVIASGDQPVLIDVETILHPDLPIPDSVVADPAAYALAASVQRTGLLPYVTFGENGLLDRSGLGGDPGESCPEGMLDWEPPGSARCRLVSRPAPYSGAQNRPRFRDQLTEPARYEADLLEGFRLGYNAIVRDRRDFTRLIERFTDLETRVIIRPTGGYARLMDETTDPGLLRDGLDLDQALDLLDQASASHRLWQRLAPHERNALWSHDIPIITSRPATRDLQPCEGCHLPDVLERSGLESASAKVAAMGEIDRGEQEWILRASLAARRPAENHHNGNPVAASTCGQAAAEPDRLLATAAGLADEIVARSKVMPGEGDQSRVNWLGLQLVDDTRWLMLPMGASLADGYLGVALFLSQLARQTGIARYAQVARRAITPIPRMLAALAADSSLAGKIGCGGNSGLGGISYSLARLATLLDDQEIREWAASGVRLAASAAGMPGPAGWWDGLAGCLAAMIAVDREIGSPDAADLAVACASRLADLIKRTAGRCGPDEGQALPGFASGPAGVGWALTQFAAYTGNTRYYEEARPALERVAGQISTARKLGYGWCCGTAGLLVARAAMADADGRAPADLKPDPAALATLAERPLPSDLSLCHGELGIADALMATNSGPGPAHALRRRADLILDAVHQHGPCCATPGGIATPGLLHGLAGIGYGLLRLGFPGAVPSVLLLESTPENSAPFKMKG